MTERDSKQQPSAVLTPAAIERLRSELEGLKTDGRTRMADRLRVAREYGDIRENAEYDAAKNEQGLMEARIRTIERLLKDPEVVDAPTGGATQVAAGMLVTVRPLEDAEEDEETYLLAASAEERAQGARTVSIESPFGKALLGKGAGEKVTYSAPGGRFSYEIVSFEPA